MSGLFCMIPSLQNVPESDQRELLRLMDALDYAKDREAAQDDFLSFVKLVWPDFIEGTHHKIMSDAFNRVASGDLKRLIINMPPRHTKSEFASYLFPAWFLGRFPNKKIIQTSHTAELSVDFGRKVRNLVGTTEYQDIFPATKLAQDSKAAGRWNTSKGGVYYAIGVHGAVTGRGADIFVIDDPVDEQTAALGEYNPEVYDRIFSWYESGPRQRLQPGGAIVLVMTRWHKRDMTGRLIEKQTSSESGSDWEVIQLPAIMPSGKALWPEFWALDELKSIREDLPVVKWQAQYQQDPTSEEGAIIKREWWQRWEEKTPPSCEFIIQSWDTAFLKTERSDYSACTTWGVFYKDNDDGEPVANIILLDAYKEKLEFPELKRKAAEKWQEYEPDAFVVEQKASGAPLIFELRAQGIPVEEFVPSRGNDKISRLNAVSDLFSSGFVWAPETKFADMVISEVAEFPAGANDDLVDSMTQALLRFRRGGFIRLDSDFQDDAKTYRRRANYY